MSALEDLRLGAKFAVSGGREGWTRTTLTAVGVALGVALLLLTTALPHALSSRAERDFARGSFGQSAVKPGPDTLQMGMIVPGQYRDLSLRGRLLHPEGPEAPLPPGLTAFPAPGELAVSPALKSLLASAEGEVLRGRLSGRVTAVIADEGLLGPHELAYYQGSGPLIGDPPHVKRITGFEGAAEPATDSLLLLLVLVGFVILLIPIAVLIAAAVRFGGDRRDRRLAALRLVGADIAMVRRIAAGEALAGSLAGLVLGTGLFFAARLLARLVTLERFSVFPADLVPAPWAVALLVVAVPASAVGVTLLALHGVVIEPLGVVRSAKPVRRRMWWRALLPVAGLALLLLQHVRTDQSMNTPVIAAGTALLLIGVTALLPWLVEALVSRLSGGPVSWQLAVRRLQLSSGTAARTVNGIAVAVAGAIALQMLLGGLARQYTEDTTMDTSRASMQLDIGRRSPAMAQADALEGRIKAIPGVDRVVSFSSVDFDAGPKASTGSITATVGTCAALREIAMLSACKDGDTFMTSDAAARGFRPAPGQKLHVSNAGAGRAPTWTLPRKITTVAADVDPNGSPRSGILVTPGALPGTARTDAYSHTLFIKADPSAPDVADLVLNAASAADPLISATSFVAQKTDQKYTQIQRGLYAGAILVLLLIGAGLLVSQLEQLRERKKLLAALVAFGTRRSTLGWSVLWQTVVPIALGLALATVIGIALGLVLLSMTPTPLAVDWPKIAAMTGLSAAVALLVTALSMPLLLRLMRPSGLRTE
ncbi:FtsX-like permease family protein [Streptomyces sp. NPDC054863]